MKILILGGDGFCGWPTALRFAAKGHTVKIVDNLSRRKIDLELSSNSLIPIASINERVKCAQKLVGDITFEMADVATQPQELRSILGSFQPDTIVHFAEQRAAPYSMIADRERRYSVDNNVSGTHNLCSAIVDLCPNAHLIHLGTMGVYGYTEAFGEIPEGYLNIKINQTGKDADILYPANPGSVYHMTKCLDQLIFQFYNKNWALKVTDLHQGIVWGAATPETSLHHDLANRFDYDGIYGTVLNRFIIQAASGNDLSVYGTGGQSRAFINISDTAECVYLAALNDDFTPEKVRIFNQVAEVQTVSALAEMVANLFNAKVGYFENPRKELAENKLFVTNRGLKSLGFNPIKLSEKLVEEVKVLADQNSMNLNKHNLNNSPKW